MMDNLSSIIMTTIIIEGWMDMKFNTYNNQSTEYGSHPTDFVKQSGAKKSVTFPFPHPVVII